MNTPFFAFFIKRVILCGMILAPHLLFGTFQEQAIGEIDSEGFDKKNPDTREVITDHAYPHSTILALEMIFDTYENRRFGSATITGKNSALTAAHNLYKNGRLPKLILAHIGSRLVDGKRKALGTLKVCQYILPKAYIDAKEKKDGISALNHDYALLFFDKIFYDEGLKEAEEVFGKVFLKPYHINLTEATLSGYPLYAYHQILEEKCFGCVHYKHEGEVIQCNDPNKKLLTHRIQSTGGQSGGSLRHQTDQGKWTLFGMHLGHWKNFGSHDLVSCSEEKVPNTALKITQELSDLLHECEFNLSGLIIAQLATTKNRRVTRFLNVNNHTMMAVGFRIFNIRYRYDDFISCLQ